MNGLPEAVRKQQVEADKAIAEFQKNQQQPSATPVVVQQPEVTTQEPEMAPVQEIQPAQEKPEEAKKPDQTPTDEDQTWRHRYETLSGKYKAEVPRLQADLRTANDIIGQLKQRLDSMVAHQPPQQPATPGNSGPQAHGARRAKPEEVETYGDVINAAERIAGQAAREESTAAAQQVYGSLSAEISAMKKNAMLSQLTSLVPNWEQINNDALFLSWCGEPDPLSGIVRQAILQRSLESFDAHRVANFFKAFEESMKQTAPADAGTVVKPPSLESQVTPRKRGPESTTTVPQKKMWKASEIKAINEDYARGRFKNRTQEFQQLSNEIDQAMKEGRVLSGQ